eukprot:6840462-Ditylum_brightwellii.AAC.3
MTVAEDKVKADETDDVDKSEAEGITEIVEKKYQVEKRTEVEGNFEREEIYDAVKKEETSMTVKNTEVGETAEEVINNTTVEKKS